jgi:hypothetical protein
MKSKLDRIFQRFENLFDELLGSDESEEDPKKARSMEAAFNLGVKHTKGTVIRFLKTHVPNISPALLEDIEKL